jgi:hypothetical protein
VQKQRGFDQTIRAKVLLGIECQEFRQARAGAVHAAFDRADIRPADLSRFLVRRTPAETSRSASRCSGLSLAKAACISV